MALIVRPILNKYLVYTSFFLPFSSYADGIENHRSSYSYLVGKYSVIGKMPESDTLYQGEIELKLEKDRLSVVRTINGKKTVGTGEIEHALGPDQVHYLKVSFDENGKPYVAGYLWRGDLGNYARLSGYVRQVGVKTTSPGLEALFIKLQ